MKQKVFHVGFDEFGAVLIRRLALAGYAILLLIGLSLARAEDYVWIGGGSGSWDNPTNWTPTGVPSGVEDTATISMGAIVDLNGPRHVAVLKIISDEAVTLENSGFGGLTLGTGSAAITCFWRASGTNTVVVNAPLVMTSLGSGTDSGVIKIEDSGPVTFNGSVAMTETVGANSRMIYNSGSATVTFAGGVSAGKFSTRQYLFPGDGELLFATENTNLVYNSTVTGFFIKPSATTSETGVGTVILGHNAGFGTTWITFGENDNAFNNNRFLRVVLREAGIEVANGFTMRGEGNVMGLGGIHPSGTATFSGTVRLSPRENPVRLFSDHAEATTRFTGKLENSGSIVIQGSGTVELARSEGNEFGGTTTVSTGTLLVNNTSGSGTSTNAVGVEAGARLGGIGRIAGPVTIKNGGLFAPGTNGVGTLTLDAHLVVGGEWIATYDAGGHVVKANVGGVLNLTGSTLRLVGPQAVIESGTPALIIATYETLVGTFETVIGPAWEIDYNYQGNQAIAIRVPQMASVIVVR